MTERELSSRFCQLPMIYQPRLPFYYWRFYCSCFACSDSVPLWDLFYRLLRLLSPTFLASFNCPTLALQYFSSQSAQPIMLVACNICSCWNLSGPNLRPETNPRRLTASYPASHILSSYLRTTVLFPRQTTTRTLPALRTLGGHLVTAVRLSSRTLWPAPTHLWIPRHRVEHPPYDGYSMTHHHCPYRLGRTESHRTDARTGSLQNGTVFHL